MEAVTSMPTAKTPVDVVLAALEANGTQAKGNPTRGYIAKCPAHDDQNPSFSLREGDNGNALVYCHAGCRTDQIIDALSLTMRDLFPEQAPKTPNPLDDGRQYKAAYHYHDEHGEVLYRVVKYTYPDGRKTFRQQRPLPDGKWLSTISGVRRVLYNLPQVRAAVTEGRTVWLTEGEKDAENVGFAFHLTATCNPGGADNGTGSKFTPEMADQLNDAKKIVIVVDNDTAGHRHARHVAGLLSTRVERLIVVSPTQGEDISAHLMAGGTIDQLETLDDSLNPTGWIAANPTDDPTDEADPANSRFQPGGTWLLSAPDQIPARWGEDDRILWAQGEPFILAGPPGVGKTTIESQLVMALTGVGPPDVLGLPVDPCQRVLVLACDRPDQLRRAFRRTINPTMRDQLDDRLVIWPGPPPQDLARNTNALYELCIQAEADVVFIDSLKDVALGLTDDEVGAGLNQAMQIAVSNGVDVAATHHQRKRQQGSGKPKALDDLYGSTWIAAGAGSVVLLFGEAGDPIVDLVHLKQPADVVGPWRVAHDAHAGTSSVIEGDIDPVFLLAGHIRGLSAGEIARISLKGRDPSDADTKRMKRRLDRYVDSGELEKVLGTRNDAGRQMPDMYQIRPRTKPADTADTPRTTTADTDQSLSKTAGQTADTTADTADTTPRTSVGVSKETPTPTETSDPPDTGFWPDLDGDPT